MDQQLSGTRTSRVRRFIAGGGLALALATAIPAAALADPGPGGNSTPGTLTCPSLGLHVNITSGSPAARAVQVVGSADVFIVRAAPEWDFAQAPGTEPKWIECVLYEPGPGGVGTLTVFGYFAR
ncbi:MAG TPA: hypothetical protein VFC71_00190 [Candidatus Polarisedimenticolia bacterium]|nr:hypothetical protein [Candidatus Polarisedimenticolia bacterium]